MTYLTDIPAIQDMAFCLGKEGCLFFTLCELAERIIHKPIDVLRAARYCIDHKLVDYVDVNPTAHLKEAFFVFERDKILEYLTGIEGIKTLKTHRISKKDKRPYYMRYSRKVDEQTTITHFVLPDYNSMYYSLTVANGAVDAYYIIVFPEGYKEI